MEPTTPAMNWILLADLILPIGQSSGGNVLNSGGSSSSRTSANQGEQSAQIKILCNDQPVLGKNYFKHLLKQDMCCCLKLFVLIFSHCLEILCTVMIQAAAAPEENNARQSRRRATKTIPLVVFAMWKKRMDLRVLQGIASSDSEDIFKLCPADDDPGENPCNHMDSDS